MHDKQSHGRLIERIRELEKESQELKHRLKTLQINEEQLRQKQKMEALGALVAGVAHEINNPINLIMFNVPLLQKIWTDFRPILEQQARKEPSMTYGGLNSQFLSENLDKLLSDMDMATNRVAKIIKDLKNFVRQSSVTEKGPVQINTAVQNAMRLAKTTLRRSGIEVVMDLKDDLPFIEGNLQAIEQIILNLIINAIEAIDHDHGKIDMTTRLRRDDGRISLQITDNGRGIDPSICDKIYDPFFTSKQAQGGIGMGLSISYSLVKAHQGDIVFNSNVHEGTSFTIFFPTTLKEKAAKILVVDDERAAREMMIEALITGHPYLVDQASNGIEACVKLGTFRPDLLILDMFMPEMDGLEVCRTIQTEPKLADMKVMMITGFPNHSKVKEVARLGFVHIYPKPIHLWDFLNVVEGILKDHKEG
jgi:signal transduction histidine kinase/ActR/RegA family two-component response regulator